MHKLEDRNTYTPTDIPHVCGNCDSVLNNPESKDSVLNLKTSSNNSDAALTVNSKGKTGQNLPKKQLSVYVLSMRGKPLMPTTPRKARHLLKEGKAKVVRRTPFTIQLNYNCGERTQNISLGVDSGYENIGLSAITNTKEVYSAEVNLRNDIVKLNSERKEYRRNRRSRHHWYRPARWMNRKKPKGWLAPSIQNKLDAHIKVIERVKEILPISKITIEVASFDIQKIRNPEISGIEYQNGVQKDSWNVREYVLHRDNHICQYCKGKSTDPILETHHLVSRQIGGDRPENLLTLCSTCHDKVTKGKLKLNVKIATGFKPETFMSIVRWQLINRLKEKYKDFNIPVEHTYGYITKHNRIQLELEKSHVNDAFVISGGSSHKRNSMQYSIKQVRKCNRKLFKGDRSHIKNTAPRFIKGFQRYDKVLWKGIECFIFGRRTTGYFDLRKVDGTKIHASAKAKELKLLESARTFLIELKNNTIFGVVKPEYIIAKGEILLKPEGIRVSFHPLNSEL